MLENVGSRYGVGPPSVESFSSHASAATPPTSISATSETHTAAFAVQERDMFALSAGGRETQR
jgi:hypothetical protein